MDDLKWENVESSNICEIAYDAEAQDLHVRFENYSHYVYRDVPQVTYDLLMRADSKGRFLNKEVKTRHVHERLVS